MAISASASSMGQSEQSMLTSTALAGLCEGLCRFENDSGTSAECRYGGNVLLDDGAVSFSVPHGGNSTFRSQGVSLEVELEDGTVLSSTLNSGMNVYVSSFAHASYRQLRLQACIHQRFSLAQRTKFLWR